MKKDINKERQVEAALDYHKKNRPGKIEVIPTKPYSSQSDLTLAYSPGVAIPCLEIEKNPEDAYDYTVKGNLVAVISNGTAVLGLGDIGALASKPVMEGKGLLFKIFAGIDVFDIEIDEKDPKKFVDIVKAIAPTFGGINLEDIKSPQCFEIEKKLKEQLNIPVMHDDQHGTAIVSAAALLNAIDIVNKKINEIKLVVNGAGASAIACTNLYVSLGVNPKNIVMCDSKGVISKNRNDLNDLKKLYATDRTIKTLDEAVKEADVFVGLSVADVLTVEMIKSMNEKPIVFALANPNPEISFELVEEYCPDIIFATGRSDYPNQVNNVLGFPFIFRGALDVRATSINEEMKLAAVRAIASLAKEPVLDVINSAYNLDKLSFGPEYIIPKPLDPRLLINISTAVAKAAIESGVAKKPIEDWEAYENKLTEMMGYTNKLLRHLTLIVRNKGKKVVYCEGNHINMVKAAIQAKSEGICEPILIADKTTLERLAEEKKLDLRGIEIIGHRDKKLEAQRRKYAEILTAKNQRKGITITSAYEKLNNRNYFGMMMVENGDADAVITGVYSHYNEFATCAKEVIGFRPGYTHFAAMNILQTKRGPLFLADTLINRWPNQETLIEITKMTNASVKFLNYEPVIAMLSYSNFGAEKDGSPEIVANAVKQLHKDNPDIVVDGEMQVNFALDKNLRDKIFPFNYLKGKDVNTLIFPNLTSGNISSKIFKEFGIGGENIGPIQMGLNKPVHFTDIESSVRDIVNLTIVAAVDAIVHETRKKLDEETEA